MVNVMRIFKSMRNNIPKYEIKKLARFGSIMSHVRQRRLETRKWNDFIVY